MRLRIVHVHVPGLGRGVDLVVELVRPGHNILLQVVVAELAVVETIGSCIDRMHLVRRGPLNHDCSGYLTPWVFLPNGELTAAVYAALYAPQSSNLRSRINSS